MERFDSMPREIEAAQAGRQPGRQAGRALLTTPSAATAADDGTTHTMATLNGAARGMITHWILQLVKALMMMQCVKLAAVI